MLRINFDKAAGYEMNSQNNYKVYTSINELENVILNRYLSQEQKIKYSRNISNKNLYKDFQKENCQTLL